MNQVLVSLELRRILPYYTEREKTEIEIFRMRGESIEMQRPGQATESAPTREESIEMQTPGQATESAPTREESIEMQRPGQASESAPTREEWKALGRKTCFSQTARGNNIIF